MTTLEIVLFVVMAAYILFTRYQLVEAYDKMGEKLNARLDTNYDALDEKAFAGFRKVDIEITNIKESLKPKKKSLTPKVKKKVSKK